jgi:hypothetical protein
MATGTQEISQSAPARPYGHYIPKSWLLCQTCSRCCGIYKSVHRYRNMMLETTLCSSSPRWSFEDICLTLKTEKSTRHMLYGTMRHASYGNARGTMRSSISGHIRPTRSGILSTKVLVRQYIGHATRDLPPCTFIF